MMQRNRTAALALALSLALPAGAAAQTAIELSPDTTIAIGGEVLGPEEIGEDDLAGTVVFTGVGVALPLGANLIAFGRTAGGDELFSTDITVNLGAVVARPGDVVLVSGGVPSLAFDADAKGLAAGVQVDELAEAADGSLLVSFDITVAVDGTTFADEDVARLDAGTGLASMEFDGSAEGVAGGLDLDAVDELASGNLLLSFDGSGVLGGVNFDDEDLLEFDPTGPTVTMNYDGSLQHVAWAASDLDAADASEAPDADSDGIPDGSDNCPGFFNPGQSDTGGIGFGSAPDGIGDDCQCGDVNGSGDVTTSDALIVRRALLVPPTAVMARPDLCDVGGSMACSTADPLIMRRALLVPPTATVVQQCAPAAIP